MTPRDEARTCGGCIKLSECAYEFGAQADDPVCTGYRQTLAVATRAALSASDGEVG